MGNPLIKIAMLICLLMLPFTGAQASEPKSYEMPRTQVVPIQESGTDRQYELYVKLPEDYAENTETIYPVIYTTDAALHMDMLSGATEFLMPDVILVGISYQLNHEHERPNISRFRDYTTDVSTNPEIQARFQRGQASNHLSFIRDEVFAYIEENYRANPRERTYFGYSLGGAFGAYILLAKPDSFKNYILGSPAFNTNSARYIDEFEAQMAPEQPNLNANVFVSLGELEEDARERVDGLMSVLRRRSGTGLALTGLEIIEDSDHGGAFPETAIRSIRWLSERSSSPSEYLGQTPPGLTPEPFAPGIVSTEHWEYSSAFSPDLSEFYFLRNGGRYERASFVVFRYEDGEWRESEVSRPVGQPFISPDGQTMHLGRRYKERAEIAWSEVEELGAPFNDLPIMRLTASANGTYYFDSRMEGQLDFPIRYSRLVDGEYEAPRALSTAINTGTYLNHPFIAPDESYLLWDAKREGGYGDSDIYISFRQNDGSWGAAINLGDEINTGAWEASATVTPDGKYLFFSRNIGSDAYENVDIYWVDAQVIENLRRQSEVSPEATAAQTELSFRDIPPLENAFIDTAPADRNDGVSVGELGAGGRNTDGIAGLAREIANGQHGNYDSLLIAHKDTLVFESYYRRGRINLAHPQASATKAYTSLILGRAIQLGHLTMADLDRPLINFLDDLDRSKLAEGAEEITLHKALTMHGGLSIDPENWEEVEENPAQLQGQGLVQSLLEHSGPITEESQTYLYGNFNPMLVMAVIDAAVPGSAGDFIKIEVLDKLGITNYSWDTHISGLPQAGWMVSMTSRDMLKLGSVILNEGVWNGEQFVSADYLARATSGLVKPTQEWMPETYRYGYFFYQSPIEVGEESYDVSFAWGGGGQRIILVDELDLTIVITGHDGDDEIMAQVANVILPAFAEQR